MDTIDEKTLHDSLDLVFKMRRSIVLKDGQSEEEVDAFIVEKSRELKAKWDSVGQKEMLLIMMSDLTDRILKDIVGMKKESTEDDELSK